MSVWLLAAVATAYLWTSWDIYQTTGQVGIPIVFLFYAMSNVGFILAARGY